MAAGAAKATNEELIERLQAAGEGTPDAAAIMGELWGYYEHGGFTIHIPACIRQRGRRCIEKKRELEAETGRAVSYEEALAAMGLSLAMIAGTLAALRKLEIASLEAEGNSSKDGDGFSLLDKLADGADMEADVIERVWQEELHAVLMSALRDIPEDTAAVIVRHYFHGISMSRIAEEKDLTRS